jgi:hypothetical protein
VLTLNTEAQTQRTRVLCKQLHGISVGTMLNVNAKKAKNVEQSITEFQHIFK